jgi:hypothetical protein
MTHRRFFMFKFTNHARAALLLLAAAAAAGAAPGASADPGQQAMAVVRDPQSGQLRPATAAEVRAMQAASAKEQRIAPQQQPAQPPTVRPDGVRSAFLGERGMVYSVVKRGPDGKLTRQCVHGDRVEHGHALPQRHSREGNHE